MHALVALLTPDFHQSKWTDQEVGVTVNNATSMSVALKNIAYRDIYRELEKARCFNFKMLDGALVTLRYRFRNGAVCEHVLCYFPSPDLDLFQNDPEIYLLDEIYADVIERNIVPFPVRFDFSDNAAKFVEVHHPYSHLTLGQYQNCIPVCSPFRHSRLEASFFEFLQHSIPKVFEELPATEVLFQNTITANERKILTPTRGRELTYAPRLQRRPICRANPPSGCSRSLDWQTVSALEKIGPFDDFLAPAHEIASCKQDIIGLPCRQ